MSSVDVPLSFKRTGLLSGSASPPRRMVNAWLAVLFAIPLFFTVFGPTSIGLGKVRPTYQSAGQTLPISVVVLLAVLALVIVKSLAQGVVPIRGKGAPIVLRATLIFVVLNILAYLVGAILSQELLGVVFLSQVVIPSLAIVVPLVTIRNYDEVEQWMRWSFIGAVIGAFALIVMNYFHYGPGLLGRSWFGYWERFGIYQSDSYVPNVLATVMPLGLVFALTARSHGRRVVAAMALLGVGTVAMHLRSLTAALIMAVAALVMGTVGMRLHLWRPRLGHALLALIVVFFPTVFILKSPLGVEAQYKLRAGATQAENEGGVNVRLAKYAEVGGTLVRSPLWGKGYTVDYTDGLGGFVESRVGKAHNQYLDLAERGGLPVLLSFVALMWIPVVRCWRGLQAATSMREQVVGAALLAALIASLTAHNVTVVPYVQPYSGIVLYALAGVAIRYASLIAARNPGARRRLRDDGADRRESRVTAQRA